MASGLEIVEKRVDWEAISYPESSGSLVSGLVARRDSGEMEFFPQKSGVLVVVRMLSFIKTEVNVSREVGMLDESLDGNQKSSMDIYINLLLGERIIALFNNMRTLKFKTKVTITFYAAVNRNGHPKAETSKCCKWIEIRQSRTRSVTC